MLLYGWKYKREDVSMMRPGLETRGVIRSPELSMILSSYKSSSQLVLKDTAALLPITKLDICINMKFSYDCQVAQDIPKTADQIWTVLWHVVAIRDGMARWNY